MSKVKEAYDAWYWSESKRLDKIHNRKSNMTETFDYYELQSDASFLAGVNWLLSEARNLAECCKEEGCPHRYAKDIKFLDLEKLVKDD